MDFLVPLGIQIHNFAKHRRAAPEGSRGLRRHRHPRAARHPDAQLRRSTGELLLRDLEGYDAIDILVPLGIQTLNFAKQLLEQVASDQTFVMDLENQ